MPKANKTTATSASVEAHLAAIADPIRRHDCRRLAAILTEVSGEPATMWGSSIIGFGSRHYKYDSGHEGDTALVGFASRAAGLTLYLTLDFAEHEDSLVRLGKHKLGKGCLYIKRLSDVDESVLTGLLAESVDAARGLSR
ncbi:MAG: DUF1801 domain-containing protein [Rhodococcus sp.]|nr:DUF1801 domain-containing protein [Rhodococcus sp. (in: high G+C Gram-positive bacteria)]